MKSQAIHDQVDELVRRALQLPVSLNFSEITFLQAQLSRYACLLCCAAIEQALIESLSSYAGRTGDFRLEEFIATTLRTGRNPTPGYVKTTLERFDPDWGTAVGTFFELNGVSDINSIVANRNRIAHGEPVQLGVGSIRAWAPSARSLSLEIQRIIDQSGPSTRRRRRRN